MVKSSPFIKKFKVWTWMVFILIVIISFVTLFQPYRTTLEKMILENFVLTSEASVKTIDQFILRSQENAKNLSHALVQHGPLDDYLNGRMTSEDVRQLSAVSFLRETANQPHLTAGVRLLFGQVNATLGKEYLPALLSQIQTDDPHELQSIFLTGRDTPVLFIAVPLTANNQIYGYDLVLYDISSLTKSLNRDSLAFAFVDRFQEKQLFGAGAKQRQIGNAVLYDNGWYTGFCLPIDGTSQSLHVSTSNAVLYDRLDDILHLNLLGFALAVGIVLFLTNRFIVYHIRHLAGHAEKTKAVYMDIANRDQLTGTFSRRYLEQWKHANEALSLLDMTHYVLAMVDVNDLKVINDTFGHKAGDSALKYVADTMSRMLRTGDVIIRYGGDEFLVLLTACTSEEADHIFIRVNQALKADPPFDFPLSVSFGTALLSHVEQMDMVIHKADEKMYAWKQKHRMAYA
ncbi:GGDEF domain-containing protein [Acidaminobacter hydrogenoformans]|uniref:Diguanylate cyclase (GGDEF) domain-containing protein n=1 Tax=Acidaminobacter hydrogenoformans DSM 2784 TaxID=1120920 RepID=A0A1G5S6X6_9FIRM|nr:diguanylate cyclase [Acidaminobacter hydrogenoformans]SCZ81877.1 diguanylate cyclase (GGDEF) domain-containing protein [Acidaminobacter hydrogenoformans DSM 2784]